MGKRIIEQHLKYKDKSMSDLIAERTKELSAGQKKLRKKWFPDTQFPQPTETHREKPL